MAEEMNIPIITVSSSPEHTAQLLATAHDRNWNVICAYTDWRGFGTKLIETYTYLKAHPEVEQFVFCDAFDVVVLGTPEEFAGKIRVGEAFLVSAERGLWPPLLAPFAKAYDTYHHRFNYANSGLYYAQSKVFIELFERFPPDYSSDDQFWMNVTYLLNRDKMRLDNEQNVFNSHSFIEDGDYGYENGRIQILRNEPVFIHKNGRSIDPKLDELLK